MTRFYLVLPQRTSHPFMSYSPMSGLMAWKKEAGEPGVADTCSPSQTYTQRKPECKWLQATGGAYLWKPFCLYYLSPRSENYSCIFLSKVRVTIGYKINSHEEVTLADHWYHFKAILPLLFRERERSREGMPCLAEALIQCVGPLDHKEHIQAKSKQDFSLRYLHH